MRWPGSNCAASLLAPVLLLAPVNRLAADGAWTRQPPTDPQQVQLGGLLGAASDRADARLGQSPFDLSWLRADVSGEVKRNFTNFSGDVSGRFLEVASLISPAGGSVPDTLQKMLATMTNYQQPDGHFGVPVQWNQPSRVMGRGTPILWGNARLLVGLVTAYETFKDPNILAAAHRLGDFYVGTSDTFCDPAHEKEFRAAKSYFSGFDVCYFPAVESLARLYLLTHDPRYLQVAERMAAAFSDWDHLPFPHTHGNLCVQYGRMLLYEITGRVEYLTPVEQRWEEACRGGYVWADGAVGEHFAPQSQRDEGCAEADWLRLNLRLWADTGKARYLDEADRLIHNEYLANQFPSGGFGHRHMECDAGGLCALLKPSQEATWCCCFHGPLGYVYLKSYLATGADGAVRLNFPVDFSAAVKVSDRAWTISCQTVTNHPGESLECQVKLQPGSQENERLLSPIRLCVRVPDWATSVAAVDANGKAIDLEPAGDGVVSSPLITGPTKLRLMYKKLLRVEDRQGHLVALSRTPGATLDGIVLRDGPDVLFASLPKGRPTLSVTMDQTGNLHLSRDDAGHYLATMRPESGDGALGGSPSETMLTLGSWPSLPESPRKVCVFNLLVAK